jgi:hypothetical protein
MKHELAYRNMQDSVGQIVDMLNLIYIKLLYILDVYKLVMQTIG